MLEVCSAKQARSLVILRLMMIESRGEQELEKAFKSFSLFTQGFDGFPFEGYFIVQKFVLPCLVEFRAHQGSKNTWDHIGTI